MGIGLTATERKNRSILKRKLLDSHKAYGFKQIPDTLDIKLFLEQNLQLWVPKNDIYELRVDELRTFRAEFKNKLIAKHQARAVKVNKKNIDLPIVHKAVKEVVSASKSKKEELRKKKPWTKYVSDLTVHQWILKYIPQFSWDLKYLEEYRNIDYSLVKDNKLQTLKLMPRDSGKSVSDIGIYAKHLCDGDFKFSVVFAGRNMLNKIWFKLINVLNSKAVVKDYGHIIAWTDKTRGIIQTYRFEEKNDANLDFASQIVTRGGELIGGHPDLIYLHDIIQEEFKSYESNEALVDWFNNVVWYMSKNIIATGTRKGTEDFYYSLKKLGFDTLHRPALRLMDGQYPDIKDIIWEKYIDEVGERHKRAIDIKYTGTYEMLPCPNYTLTQLLIDRSTKLSYFEANMQNMPISETGLMFFKKNWLLTEAQMVSYYPKYWITVDSAYGEKREADNTSLIVFTHSDGELIIVDGFYGKLTYDQIGEYIMKFHLKYHQPGSGSVVLQIYLHQDFAEVWLRSNQLIRKLPNLTGIRHRIPKRTRIQALTTPWNMQLIKISNAVPFINEAYKEYIMYDGKDSTATKKDDFLDALATGYMYTSYQMTSINDIYKTKAYTSIT